MRVAYICADPGVPVFGTKGCSIHVQEILRALLRAGHRVELFATRFDADCAPTGLETLRVHRLPPCPRGELVERERACLSANTAIRDALERHGPFDLVYERYSLWCRAGMAWATDRGVPGVIEVNAPLIDEQAAHRGLVDRSAAESVARDVFRAASSVIAVSTDVARWVTSLVNGSSEPHVIPNGVDPTRFRRSIIPALPREPGTCTIGFVGTLKPWHGLEFLAALFSGLYTHDPAWRLLIVGDGPLREPLERDFAARRIDRAVRYTGAVPAADVPALLASVDVAVAPYPSTGPCYFSPLKLFEYMAAGLPVIASRVGQIEDVVEDGRTGLLCAADDLAAWSAALRRVRRDSALRESLGRAARAAAATKHSWDSVLERILRTVAPPVPPDDRTVAERAAGVSA